MVTLLELRTQIKQRIDIENSEYVSNSELTSDINSSYAELTDLLIQTVEDYYTTSTGVVLSDSSGLIPLPSGTYKIRGLDFQIDGSQYATVRSFNFIERNFISNVDLNFSNYPYAPLIQYKLVGNQLMVLPADQANGTYRIWYTPTYLPLVNDSDSVTVGNGFEEYIVVDCCIKILAKQDRSVYPFDQQKAALTKRILAMAPNRDQGEPMRVSRTRRRGVNRGWGDDY